MTDFGIARPIEARDGETQTGTVLGTCDYISPEQAQGKRVDALTDVYSLGVVLYELLTGEVPFSGDNFVAIAMQHINAPPPPVSLKRPEVPARVEAAVERALAKDPAGRFPTMAAFADELEACLAEVRAGGDTGATGILPIVRRTRGPDRATTTGRRHRRRNIVVAVLAVLAAAAIAAAAIIALDDPRLTRKGRERPLDDGRDQGDRVGGVRPRGRRPRGQRRRPARDRRKPHHRVADRALQHRRLRQPQVGSRPGPRRGLAGQGQIAHDPLGHARLYRGHQGWGQPHGAVRGRFVLAVRRRRHDVHPERHAGLATT